MTPYLPASFYGPTWANRMVEFFALIQIAGCYQVRLAWALHRHACTSAGGVAVAAP